MSKSPPRPSDHSVHCPAYSPSAKYSSCTCGVFTHRKSKRPTIEEAAEKAVAIESAELEAERKSAEQRAAMEAMIFGVGTIEQQKPAPTVCRRCSECIGQEHHWIEGTDLEGVRDPEFACKHCEALSHGTDDADGFIVPLGRLMTAAELDADGRVEDELPDPWAPGGEADQIIAIGRTQRTLDEIADGVSTMAGRIVCLRREGEERRFDKPDASSIDARRVYIHQVCPACREQHAAPLHESIALGTKSGTDEWFRLVGAVGVEARKARIRHRCPSITDQLPATMTRAELEQLAQEVENAGTMMVDRSISIAKLAKERQS